MEVYNHLGPGFLEAVYQEALEIELEMRGIPFESQRMLVLYYKDRRLKKEYKPDFLCYEQIIVELKAIEKLTRSDEAQIINYLTATRLKVGVLLNFGSPEKLEWKRFVH